MQNYLTEILLGLNLVAVLYLVVLSSYRKKSAFQQDLHQKIIENQIKISHEIAKVKESLEHLKLSFAHKSQQWKAERLAFESSTQTVAKTKYEENLFLNDRYKEIFDLQEKGLSVEQIAKELEKGHGEVSFILQLAAQARSKKGA